MNIFLTTSYNTRVLPSRNNDENGYKQYCILQFYSHVHNILMQTKLKLIHKSINHNNVDNSSELFLKRTKA